MTRPTRPAAQQWARRGALGTVAVPVLHWHTPGPATPLEGRRFKYVQLYYSTTTVVTSVKSVSHSARELWQTLEPESHRPFKFAFACRNTARTDSEETRTRSESEAAQADGRAKFAANSGPTRSQRLGSTGSESDTVSGDGQVVRMPDSEPLRSRGELQPQWQLSTRSLGVPPGTGSHAATTGPVPELSEV